MWSYEAPLRDMQFVLEHWLQAPTAWQALDLPLAHCTVLPGVGRWPNLEAPEEFDGAVLSFLADTAPGMRRPGALH